MVLWKKVTMFKESLRIDSDVAHCTKKLLIWILIFCISLPGYASAGVSELPLPELQAIHYFDVTEVVLPGIGFETSLTENIIPLSLLSLTGEPADWPVNNTDLYFPFTIYEDLRFIQGLSFPEQPFGRYQKLVNHSAAIALLAIGSIALLYVAPESVSGWKEEDKDMSWDELSSRYCRKVSSGPVVDEDENWINYIGHPYFGGIYYTHARNIGYTRTEAFMFSLAMSTIIYEYGFEAFFEQPSIQDLIFTPFWGAMVGEFFLFTGAKIKANNNKLLGSQTFGKICLVLMDPIGYTIGALSKCSSKFSNFGMSVEYIAKVYNAPNDLLMTDYPREYMYGLQINIFTR